MAQFDKILVPVDFSEASNKALSYGLSLALEMEAELIVLHVIPFSPALAYVYPVEGHQVNEEEITSVRTRLMDLIPPEHHDSISVRALVQAGDVSDTLSAQIEEEKPDLIVMGTRGRRRFERWMLGSVTEHMLRRVHVPLLTVAHVDEAHTIEKPAPVPLDRLLYATDLSSESVDATKRAIELAHAFSAELVILHVVQNLGWALGSEFVPLDVESRTVQAREAAFEYLVNSVPESAREDPRVRIELRDGLPFEVILEFAASDRADLIVLNTQSRTGLDRALLGSTAERVVRGATVPVLSLPGRGT
jgi:nucleotide-binding universal stress UspA family protein